MSRFSRLVLAMGALSLGLLYFLPLWHIGLKAPQYPEGLGLYIAMNEIRGEQPQDLNSINGLNHYIGMKKIEPDAIPELRIMPWVIRLLILSGVGVAVYGKRWPLGAWVTAFFLGALGGLVDFWRWGYDYGHNLDPHAAIRIPGMTYQPPLIGGKQLLNFHARSWPAAGGWIAVGVLAVSTLILVMEIRRKREARLAGSAG